MNHEQQYLQFTMVIFWFSFEHWIRKSISDVSTYKKDKNHSYSYCFECDCHFLALFSCIPNNTMRNTNWENELNILSLCPFLRQQITTMKLNVKRCSLCKWHAFWSDKNRISNELKRTTDFSHYTNEINWSYCFQFVSDIVERRHWLFVPSTLCVRYLNATFM